MITCTFAGHRDMHFFNNRERLMAEIEKLLQMDNEFLFLNGDRGDFDRIGAGVTWEAKRRHPEKSIKLALVLPYLSKGVNRDKDYYRTLYDEIIIPEEADNAHYKAAIRIRNRWMVDQSDIVFACVSRNYGGAFETVKYAKRHGKTVINLAE